MKQPIPNGPPVKLDDGRTVKLRVCACCKDDAKTKRRYFVYRGKKLVRMSLSWEGAIGE